MKCTSLRPGGAPVEFRISDFGFRIGILALLLAGVSEAAVATFDDLMLPAESYWNGADGSGGFTSGGIHFENHYNAAWGAWDGFAYANRTDPNRPDPNQPWVGQYTAIPGGGQGGSPNYGIGYVAGEPLPTLTLATPQVLSGLYVTNNAYAYYDMLYGGAFSQKFAGSTSKGGDWFKLTITGLDAAGKATGAVDFYLADFRGADPAKYYILKSWAFVNLTSLGEVQSLQFNLDSSDKGSFGLNTPAYFCIDTVVPCQPLPEK
jgi:hypothetical protein